MKAEQYTPGAPIAYHEFLIFLSQEGTRREWRARAESRDGKTVRSTAGHPNTASALTSAKAIIDSLRGA